MFKNDLIPLTVGKLKELIEIGQFDLIRMYEGNSPAKSYEIEILKKSKPIR